MRFTLQLGDEVNVPVGVDHGQFIACDREAELDIDSYGRQASREGLAVWGGGSGVTVFTASDWMQTQVALALHAARPTLEPDAWDHVVEAGITLRSGHLHVYGPEDTLTDEASVELPPGTYSLLVCGAGLHTASESDEEGADRYALWLWPGPSLRRRVLKDGFSWMD